MPMKNLLYILLAGLLLALGWPTYGFPLLLFVGFVPLLLVTESLLQQTRKRTGWRQFRLNYLAFFIFNIITTWWLYYSTPFGMWFAILANTLLMTLVWQSYYFVRKRVPILPSFIFLVGLWMLFEKMHLVWDFAWPWLNLGNGFATYTQWIQWYEYTGTFGGTLWIWVVNGLIFFALRKQKHERQLGKELLKIGIAIGLPILISYLILLNYHEIKDPVNVVLLQPNIDPYTEKYNTTNERIADLLFEDARKALTDSTAFLIAPETVLAEGFGVDLRKFESSSEKLKAKKFLRDYPNLNFLAGIQFYRFYRSEREIIGTTNYLGDDRLGNKMWGDFFNSAIMLNSADTSQIYHKSKLVVGVENFPYQSTLKPLLGDIMLDLGGTVAMKTIQSDRSVFTGIDDTTVAPVICYESVFGEFVAGFVKNDASYIAIITNDAWWDNTQGHKQHLSYARLRAIETRRSIARSANTGISAIINQKGEIEKQLGYGLRGTVTGQVNKNTGHTFYVKYGDYLPRIALFPVIAIFIFSLFKRKKLRY